MQTKTASLRKDLLPRTPGSHTKKTEIEKKYRHKQRKNKKKKKKRNRKKTNKNEINKRVCGAPRRILSTIVVDTSCQVRHSSTRCSLTSFPPFSEMFTFFPEIAQHPTVRSLPVA